MANEGEVKPPPFIPSSFTRITSWVHWVKLERPERGENDEVYQDRQLFASDIDKFVQVANAAHDVLLKVPSEARTDEEKELQAKIDNLWVP